MNNKYKIFIAGRSRMKDKTLEICDLFDDLNIFYYCFLKKEYKTNNNINN